MSSLQGDFLLYYFDWDTSFDDYLLLNDSWCLLEVDFGVVLLSIDVGCEGVRYL